MCRPLKGLSHRQTCFPSAHVLGYDYAALRATRKKAEIPARFRDPNGNVIGLYHQPA